MIMLAALMGLGLLLVVLEPRFTVYVRAMTGLVCLALILAIGLTGIKDHATTVGQMASAMTSVIVSTVTYYLLVAVIDVYMTKLHLRDKITTKVEQLLDRVDVRRTLQKNPKSEPALLVARGTQPKVTNFIDPPLLTDPSTYRIKINGEIDERLEEIVRGDCLSARKQAARRVCVQIDSGGGAVSPANAIRRMIQELDCDIEVVFLVTGACMSAAVQILTCLPLEKRFALPEALFMIHKRKYMDILRDDDDPCLKTTNKQLQTALVAETFIKLESLESLVQSGRDFHFGPEKALELGVIGTIL